MKLRKTVSRRRIGRVMKKHGLVFNYTVAQFKPNSEKPNEDQYSNELNREFTRNEVLSVVVYLSVGEKWNYICVFIDLFNREIIGYSTGSNKDALLVYSALASIKEDLHLIQLFHTDRRKEFKIS